MSEDLRPNRRIVFQGLGALGVAAALAACGGGSGGPSDAGSTPTAGKAGEALASTSEIPVGGGIVLTDKHLVITQPTKGEFKAFSSVCLHQGFDVGKVEGGTITCLHHNSTYDAATGAVTGGPAPSGGKLAAVAVKVEGDKVVAA
jgi:nitrite reductase/ring-hydroxylating ferredoxin subunit